MKITTLSKDQEISSQNIISLPDGKYLLIQVITQGDSSDYIVAEHILDNSFAPVTTGKYTGSCDGKVIGSVICPNEDPVLNCVNGTIGCAS